MSIAVYFQYLAHEAVGPVADDPLTDELLIHTVELPFPRVGEFLTYSPTKGNRKVRTFVVLAVHHRLMRRSDEQCRVDDWHVVVTLGDPPLGLDKRLLAEARFPEWIP